LSSAITAGDIADFTTFNLVVYNTAGDRLGDLSILSEGTATGISIASSETLFVRFEIDPLTDATTGYLAFTITLTYS